MADNEETTHDRKNRERDEQRQKERSNKLKKSKYLENIIDRKNVEIYNIYIQLKMNIRIARELYKLKPEHIDSGSLPVSIYYKEKEYFYEEGTFDKYRESIKLLKGINFDETAVEDTDAELETNKRKKLKLPEYIYDNRDDNRGKQKYIFDKEGILCDNRGKPGFIEEGINLMKHAPRPRSEEGISLYDVLCEDLAYTLDEDYKNDKQNSYLKSLQKIAEEEEEERKKDEEFLGEKFLVLGKEFLGSESDRILFMDLLDKQRKLFDEEKKELTDIELVEDLKNKFRIVETLRSEKVIDITTLPLASRILRDVMKEGDYSYLENPGSKDIELYNNLVYSTDLLSTELYKPYFFFDKKIYFFLVLLEPDSTKNESNSTKYSSHINNIIKFTKNEEGTVIEDDDLVRKYKANKISINESIRYLIDNAPKSREGISLYDAINETINETGEAGAAAEAAAEGGGKRKSKGNSKKVSKKPVVSQKKQSECKEILGKKMKIYKMPDSRKEYVKYKGELLHISDYKDLMKQKAMVKTKTKTKTKVTKETKATQQKAIEKTKTKTKETKETNVTKATQQKAIEKTKTKTKTKTKETKATQQKAKSKAKK
jgi:hypothetical protein